MKKIIAIPADTLNPFMGRERQHAAVVMNVSVVERRLREVLDSTMHERWLPIGFRTLIVQEMPRLRSELGTSKRRERAILDIVGILISAAEEYGRAVMRSRTVNLLQSFEYEFVAKQIAA